MRLLLSLAIFTSLISPAVSAELPSWDKSAVIVDNIMTELSAESDHFFHQGEYMRAANVHRMVYAYQPSNLEAYYLAAWLTWSSGRDEEAQEIYMQAVRSDPDNYDPYMEIGLHWSGRREDVKAGLWLTMACNKGAPVQAWKTLSHTYRKLGLKDDALRVMLIAQQMDPDDEAIALNIGWLKEAGAKGPSEEQ